MSNVVSCKETKIKPENAVSAEGTVVKCRYCGSSRVGIGPFGKTTHRYKVFIEAAGLAKPLVLLVREKDGWNHDIVGDVKTLGKMFGKNAPVNVGDKIMITYDSTKPKKCNISG